MIALTTLGIACAASSSEIRRVELSGPSGFQARLRVCEALSSPQRIGRLRDQVKARFPDTTDESLAMVFIACEVAPDTVPEAQRPLALLVGMRYDPAADRSAIVDYGAERLRSEAATLLANAK
jgi:hypothetical protein